MSIERGWPMTAFERVHTTLASIASAIILVVAAFMLTTVYWSYDIVQKMKIEIVGTPRAGSTLWLQLDYCQKPTHIEEKIITLQNDITIVLPARLLRLPAGCHQTKLWYALPKEIPAGQYTLGIMTVFAPWPWHSVITSHSSAPFRIEAAQ